MSGFSSNQASAFNRSIKVLRTPTKQSSATKTNMGPAPNVTKEKIPCNKCEISDIRSKLLCSKCKRWWHLKCDPRDAPTKVEVASGKWICFSCFQGDTVVIIDENDITRVNLSSEGLLGSGKGAMVNKHSTMLPIVPPVQRPYNVIPPGQTEGNPTEPKSTEVHLPERKSEKNSHRSHKSKLILSSQERIALINQDLELAKRPLEVEAELKRIQVARAEISATHSGRVSITSQHSSVTNFRGEEITVSERETTECRKV